ncbi:energy-coupling factor transport system ATP-binding protein [Microcella alkaliphila]|uniref:Energy-coupling factor transport system ATP-binding protein n=1 Tax=Microcella alkaliphila TaxID=279828 RepID=A0A4V2FMY2_9MICO|nr:ATP-binding cassette domain-containing protein [Microcella alkaliphila]RZT59369.1 energy-coupling factor transport system ATP-binding protein [Microcella alkaliphila]
MTSALPAGAGTTTHPRAARLAAHGFGWRPRGRKAPVLADVDLAIEAGERVLVLGASGSGKSTLLQAFAGVLGGDDDGDRTGNITVDGRDPADARGRVGLLLQDPEAGIVLERAGDDLAFGPENLGVPVAEIAKRLDGALDRVGLDIAADRRTPELSGGQQQRLALAGVLALEPGALLLDEPTAQLDPAGVGEIVDAVIAAVERRGLTLVVIEHRVDVWLPHIDRVIVLDRGRVIADGDPASVLEREGEALAERGVWVPGRPPVHPPAAVTAPARERTVLLEATGLAAGPAGAEPVVENIDLTVRAGEVIALTGPNGAGKSTLALALAGLLPRAAGTVTTADGVDPATVSSVELSRLVGVVFQNPEHQFVAATVRDELALGAGEVPAALLDRLGLARRGGTSPYRLSGGEKRRLSVATAIAAGPPVLILDEPTFGQDRRTWAELAALIAEHRDRGGAVIMATHDRELIAALGARELRLPARPPRLTPDEAGEPVAAGGPSAGPVSRPPLLERLNPVAALAAGLFPALILVATIDIVSAAVALALQLLLLPLLGVDARTLVRRTAPVWIAAPLSGLTILLYGQTSGQIYAEFLFVRISDGSIELAIATVLRVLAIGIPAVALFARVDVTRFGDALAQTLRLPARFVLGAVAALRMLGLLGSDMRMLERARRARGLGDRGRIRRLPGLVLALLVLAIRRGAALAVAMEARGFGAPVARTWTRPSPWRGIDSLALAVAVAVAVIATVAAVATGQWNSILTGREFG